MCRRRIPALDPKPVILVPETSCDTLDFALDARSESGAGFERLPNQVPQIAVIVPTRTSCHGMDKGVAQILLPSRNDSLFSVVAARPASQEHRTIGVRILWHDASDVGVDDAIHRPVKGLARLHPPIEEPSESRVERHQNDASVGCLPASPKPK